MTKTQRDTFTDLFTPTNIFNLYVYCTSSERNEKKNNGNLKMHLVTELEQIMNGQCLSNKGGSSSLHWLSPHQKKKKATALLHTLTSTSLTSALSKCCIVAQDHCRSLTFSVTHSNFKFIKLY